MRRHSAILLAGALSITTGCAYTLNTGNLNIDGGCHCFEKTTAPIVKACTYTAGGVLALAGSAAANSDEICSDELVRNDRDNDNSGEQHGGDPSPPQPEGKPLC